MSTRGISVLIVDPQPGDYEVLGQEFGEHVQFLQTGRAALNIPMREGADTWIINVNLPDMSGFELYEDLRERYSGSRFVLVGDDYRPEDEVKARTSGAARYLCKPPQPWWLEQLSSDKASLARKT